MKQESMSQDQKSLQFLLEEIERLKSRLDKIESDSVKIIFKGTK